MDQVVLFVVHVHLTPLMLIRQIIKEPVNIVVLDGKMIDVLRINFPLAISKKVCYNSGIATMVELVDTQA